MDESIQPLAAETEAIRQAYAALNRNDIAGFVKAFDPEIERIEPAEFPSGGTYHGIEAVEGTRLEGTLDLGRRKLRAGTVHCCRR